MCVFTNTVNLHMNVSHLLTGLVNVFATMHDKLGLCVNVLY